MSGQRDTEGRTGRYGGDDGAMENERAEISQGEDPDIVAGPPTDTPSDTTHPERKQDKDRKTGEENPA